MIISKNVFYHELVGLFIKIIESSNESLIGISGTIINETKKTFLIEINDYTNKNSKIKMIPKDVSVFHFFLPNKEIIEINGKILTNHPEDRIKKRYKKIH